MFWMHHSQIDRFFTIWEDCWDHDEIPEFDLGANQYQAYPTNAGGMDDCMPYGNSPYFASPACVTPRMIFRPINNTLMPGFSYYYEDDNMISLLSSNFPSCTFHYPWLNSAGVSAVQASKASTTDVCNQYNNDCNSCTSQNGCGICADNGICSTGSQTGPASSTCQYWFWSTSSCGGKRSAQQNGRVTGRWVGRGAMEKHLTNASTVGSSPVGLSDFFNEAYADSPPDEATNYQAQPGQFQNMHLQFAKQQIDNYFAATHGNRSSVRLDQDKMKLYQIAECMVEGVHGYITEQVIHTMHLENLRHRFIPPCHNHSLPVAILVPN